MSDTGKGKFPLQSVWVRTGRMWEAITSPNVSGNSPVNNFLNDWFFNSSATTATINWLPAYDAQVKPYPKLVSQFNNSEVIPTPPAPATINSWYPSYDATVEPVLSRQQFTTTVMPVIPSPISRINWYPIFEATVKPFALAPKVWFTEAPLSSIAQNKWYPIYDAQVEPYLTRAQHSTIAGLLSLAIPITNWYPVYDSKVVASALSAKYSIVTQVPLTRTLLNWLPEYPSEVKLGSRTAQYSVFSQPPLLSINQNSWYPTYASEVKRFLRSLDSLVVAPPIVIITPSGSVQIIWNIGDDIFTMLFS